MKQLFSLIILTIFSFIAISQNQTIDSLKNDLKSQSEIEKISTLCDLAKEYYSINPDTGLIILDEATLLIKKTKEEIMLSKLYYVKGLLFFDKFDMKKSKIWLDSSIIYGKKYEQNKILGNTYNALGSVYQIKTEYDSALLAFDSALYYYKNISDIENKIAKVYDNQGIVYYLKGDNNNALDKFFKARDLCIEIKDTNMLASSFYKIAAVYSEQENYVEAELNALKSYELLKNTEQFLEIVRILNILGITKRKQGNYQKSLEYYFQALEVLKNKPNPYTESSILGNIGIVYFEMNEYEKAKEYHIKAMNIAKENNLRNISASSLNNLGDVELKLGNTIKAEKYFRQSVEIYEQIKENQNILKLYEKLYDVYKIQKKYEVSLIYHEKYFHLYDSLNAEKKNKSLDSLLTLFKTEELENENLILEHDTELKNKTIKNQQNFILLFILIIILIIVFSIIIFRDKNKLKKAYNTVNEKNEEITLYSEELKTTNEKLIELDNFKEGLMQMIVHDLKNPLNNLLNIDIIKSHDDQIKVVKQTSNLLLNQTYNILDIYKYENSKMNLTLENYNLNKLVFNACGSINHLIKNKNIELTIKINESDFVKCDKEIVTRVVVNIMTNSIKFSDLNSEIIIENMEKEKYHEVSITNFGAPIPEEYHNKIFEKFSQVEGDKSGQIRSTGLGLAFCKLAIESHNSKIFVDSNFTDGTKLTFQLPKGKKDKNSISEITFSQKTNSLNSNDISYLSQYYSQISKTPVYKISDISKIIDEIKKGNSSKNITQWCDELYNCAINSNQDKYFLLLEKIKQ